MTVKLLLVKSENGLETRQDYDGLSANNPTFTGVLTGASAALTGDVDAGGEIKSGALAGAGARPLVALADGTINNQDAAAFRGTIGALAASLKGAANGVAELGSDGRVPLAQLPSYVDETVEYPDFASFPTTGEDGKIYVAIDDGTSWRWSGTIYAQISSSLTLGSTASTAHRGDHGVIAYNHSQLTADNPHGTTAAQVGAEPYAGAPAQTSFWRSTAAGVRAWVQLVAEDITDLATTLAGYLTKANPTYTGNVYGAGSVIWRAPAADHYFSLYGIETEFGLRDLNNSGSILNYPVVVKRGAAGEVQIGYSGGLRPVRIGGAIRNDSLAGTGIRPLVALADGTLDDQDAATFRGTIGALAASLKGAANGVAELGADGRVPSGQLPSYVDDVLEYANFAALPATGETGKIYINLDQNKTWRWSGSGYTEISASLALGETSATAYRGDRGKIAYDHSQATGNPHGTTAAQVGAEPYAGAPAQTSFWRSTAAGVRAWVQLVAADITDLATVLAGYLTKANPDFTGALKQSGTTRITSGGGADFASLRVSNLSSAFNGVLTSDYVGVVGVRGAADFRDNYIQAAASDHNHFSKLDVSASTTLGAIDESAIKVTTTDVILTLSGGVDGQGWDIINPTASTGIAIPSGATLWKSIGSDVGPTTIALGGGRPIRITRIDANTWTMLGSQ